MPRQLKAVQPPKAKDYLDLAGMLLRRFPSDTSGRAVEFLVDVCENSDPGALPPLPWFTAGGATDLVRMTSADWLAKLVPAVRFQALIKG